MKVKLIFNSGNPHKEWILQSDKVEFYFRLLADSEKHLRHVPEPGKLIGVVNGDSTGLFTRMSVAIIEEVLFLGDSRICIITTGEKPNKLEILIDNEVHNS